MNLFSDLDPENILPCDGEVVYYGKIIPGAEADRYTEYLYHHIAWQHDEALIFGKHIVTARKVAWYADEPYSYTYSGITRAALRWTDELLELKHLTEKKTGLTFNSCLLNLYHTGNEGMAYHSDDEKTLVADAGIASLSFGAERRFLFKHKSTRQTVSCNLENGSLLLMKGSTQRFWQHRLPTTKKILGARINLTFRTMHKHHEQEKKKKGIE